MPATPQKDLFDDSTMSFGEHLEELRVRLFRGLIGLAIGVLLMLFIGDRLIEFIRIPIDNALRTHHIQTPEEEGDTKIEDRGFWDYWDHFKGAFGWGSSASKEEEDEGNATGEVSKGVRVEFSARDLLQELNKVDDSVEVPAEDDDKKITVTLWAEEFKQFKIATEFTQKPITLTVQEAFLTYIKVSVVAGLVLTAPWLFYQIWMFVAAGLYPHEKKYVYIFLPVSTILFLTGALFCFFAVFPFVLKFLLGFNQWLNTAPQIRLSEWISFAIMLPVMFGVSFQLPLVMLFLERISIFEVKGYREQRRMAILVIAILSMLLTPSDPMSMMMMMIPLCLLYELGIWMCNFMEKKRPFEAEDVNAYLDA